MKLSATTLLAFLATSYGDTEDRGCVNNAMQDGTDLFPVKVFPTHSEFWDIEYFSTFKIVTNKEYDLTYLLHQCGTEVPPEHMDGRHAAVLEIPLTDVAISQTPMISFMEQLHLRDRISAFLSSASFVASPCFAADIASGKVNSVDRGDEETAPSFTGLDPPDEAKLVSFIASWESTSPPPLANKAIVVSEADEKTNNAMFEWVKFFAVFFNEEELANQVFDAARSRYACVSENAGRIASDEGQKTKLLWAYYSDYCGGWDVAECPNYYCEIANACSAEIMASTEGSNEAAKEKCGATYMTDEEFFAHAKEADFWFFPSFNWAATEAMFNQSLPEIKAYREKRVYDYMGRGDNAWFEQRFAEYYKVVEDVCHTLGVKQSLVGRHFWRNVFTEDIPASGVDAPCDEESAANILADPDTCVSMKTETSAVAAFDFLWGVMLTVVAAFFV